MHSWREIIVPVKKEVGYDDTLKKIRALYYNIKEHLNDFHIINHSTIDVRFYSDFKNVKVIKKAIKKHVGNYKLKKWKHDLHRVEIMALSFNTKIMFEMIDSEKQGTLLKSIVHYIVNQFGHSNHSECEFYLKMYHNWNTTIIYKVCKDLIDKK